MSLLRALSILLLMLGPVCPVYATSGSGVSLNQTRVIFPAGEKAQTLAVKNEGLHHYIIQSRIQRGLNDQKTAPFIVTPPLFQLGAKNKQLLRILKQEQALPEDRESLFYLSVLAVPTQKESVTADVRVSMGFQFLIKLLYRPQGLPMSMSEASCQLQFSTTPDGVRVENATPYFLTFGSLIFDQTELDLNIQPSMIAPLSNQTYQVNTPVNRVQWQTLTDVGGISSACQQSLSAK